ncbi:MAG: glycosyl transferase family protein [Parahaliea sp.]
MSAQHFDEHPQHPFATFVRILGKGKKGTRSLTQSEANEAFGMILQGKVEPLQLGAFLMLLRVKETSAEELAGFVEACRKHIAAPLLRIDLDWSSYAGKKHQHPWYILSILLLAQAGWRIFIHGAEGHTANRLYTEQAMQGLGLPLASHWQDVATQLDNNGFAYLSLGHFCPELHRIMQLQPILGLRSPVNTFTRMLNPLAAPAAVQSIFHPAYAELHRDTDALLAQPRSLVFKGDSGEVEIKPPARTRLIMLVDGQRQERVLPATLPGRTTRVEQLSVEPLRQLWCKKCDGMSKDHYGELATLATTSAVLQVLEPQLTPAQAYEYTLSLWQQRDRSRLKSCL